MKEINLTKGLKVMVDDSDFDRLNKVKWYALKPKGNNNYYAARGVTINGKNTTQYMHKVLFVPLNPLNYVDHENRNTLDCQRHNLREATPTQNRYNSKARGKSKYLGVSEVKKQGRVVGYQVGITLNSKRKYLGIRMSEIEAAKLYNHHAVIHYGEFANLNIID